MLKSARSYEEACRTFRWRIPERYNIAFDVCDRQTMGGADGHRTALIVEAADGSVERYTFHVLRLLSNRLANVLAAGGVVQGDRVALALPAGIEAAVGLLAVLRMGAVAVPVSAGLGAEPLAWRLLDSGARAAVVGAAHLPVLEAVLDALPDLHQVLTVGDSVSGACELWGEMQRASDSFPPLLTNAGDSAFLLYPGHGCGRPRAAVHAHRAMPGNLPAVELALDFFPHFGDVMWTPGEWMTADSLLEAVLPAWHHGVPVLASAAAFEPGKALELMARHGVRVARLAPTHLARLAEAAGSRPHPMPRALMTGPEPLDAALHEQVRRAFGCPANEAWGSLETGAVAANNAALMERHSDSPGRAVPGVTVEAIDGDGRPLPAKSTGMLAVAPGTPGAFLGWWGGRPEDSVPETGWIPTGRLGSRDLDGYLWPDLPPQVDGELMVEGQPVSAADIEAALGRHPGVRAAAVIQIPRREGCGGELKAFVVARGRVGDVALARELQDFVAARRAVHEIPRRVEFVDELPASRDELLARPLRLDAPATDERWTPPRK